MTITYRGLELPAELFDPRTFPTMSEPQAGNLLAAQVHYLNGVDQGLGAETPTPNPEPEFEYWHDGDYLGNRYYRRIQPGADETTHERFYEGEPDLGWVNVDHNMSRTVLPRYSWTQVPESELPEAAR